jgi:hypothetical protein
LKILLRQPTDRAARFCFSFVKNFESERSDDKFDVHDETKEANVQPLQSTITSSRLTAPPSLTTDEQTLFTELIDSVEPRHFTKSDLPQIVSYVQVTLACRAHAAKIKTDPSKDVVSGWDKLLRAQLALARALRLTVQSRVDPLTIGRRANGHGRPLTYSDMVRLQNGNDPETAGGDADID